MSTYVLMRMLESAPDRYERGMRLLTLGHVERAYDRLAGHIQAGQRVLDLGCGPGALTLRAAQRGATVKAIDVNPEMLDQAARRLEAAGLRERVELAEMGVAELDLEPARSFDAVMGGLCLSELCEDELTYTLAQAARILRPGGLLLVADEVRPAGRGARWVHKLLRAPLVLLTWLVTQQTTRPIQDLAARVAAAGLEVVSTRTSPLRSFAELVAARPAAAAG